MGLCVGIMSVTVVGVKAQDQGSATPTSASAPATRGKHHHKWACAADIKNLCPDAKSFKAKRQCLKENKDQLSSACKAQMKKMHAKIAGLKEACQADVSQFCSDAKGGRAIGKCLKQNEASLSASCVAARAKMKRAWKKHHHKNGDGGQSQGTQNQAPASQTTQQ